LNIPTTPPSSTAPAAIAPSSEETSNTITTANPSNSTPSELGWELMGAGDPPLTMESYRKRKQDDSVNLQDRLTKSRKTPMQASPSSWSPSPYTPLDAETPTSRVSSLNPNSSVSQVGCNFTTISTSSKTSTSFNKRGSRSTKDLPPQQLRVYSSLKPKLENLVLFTNAWPEQDQVQSLWLQEVASLYDDKNIEMSKQTRGLVSNTNSFRKIC
jgi:hypothetical protein